MAPLRAALVGHVCSVRAWSSCRGLWDPLLPFPSRVSSHVAFW